MITNEDFMNEKIKDRGLYHGDLFVDESDTYFMVSYYDTKKRNRHRFQILLITKTSIVKSYIMSPTNNLKVLNYFRYNAVKYTYIGIYYTVKIRVKNDDE